MADANDNPPAFARSAYAGSNEPNTPCPHHEQQGLSLRDYFAAHCPISFGEFVNGWKRTATASTSETMEAYARFRVLYADAMLAARKDPTNG